MILDKITNKTLTCNTAQTVRVRPRSQQSDRNKLNNKEDFNSHLTLWVARKHEKWSQIWQSDNVEV